MNQILLTFAEWLDTHGSSTALHESIYLYSWIETTHVMTLMLFLGMLCVIDLRMLGVMFTGVPASKMAAYLDRPMFIGFFVMVITGLLLFYAIPVRTTQSIWFRIKVVLLIAAGINAFLFRRKMRLAAGHWDNDPKPPPRIRAGAAASLTLWCGVVFARRAMAYDWFDCHKPIPGFISFLAGCDV